MVTSGSEAVGRNVVIEGVDGEVAQQAVFFDRAEEHFGVVERLGHVFALARLHEFELVVGKFAQREHHCGISGKDGRGSGKEVTLFEPAGKLDASERQIDCYVDILDFRAHHFVAATAADGKQASLPLRAGNEISEVVEYLMIT